MDNPQFEWLNDIVKKAQDEKANAKKEGFTVPPGVDSELGEIVQKILTLHLSDTLNAKNALVSVCVSVIGSVVMNKVLHEDIPPGQFSNTLKAMVFDLVDMLTDSTPVTCKAIANALEKKLNEDE